MMRPAARPWGSDEFWNHIADLKAFVCDRHPQVDEDELEQRLTGILLYQVPVLGRA